MSVSRQIIMNRVYTKDWCGFKVNQKFISHLARAQRTPSAAVTVQVSHALTLRRLMSCIYMQHPFLMFLDHTQRRSTVGRTSLDE